jgi:putative protease
MISTISATVFSLLPLSPFALQTFFSSIPPPFFPSPPPEAQTGAPYLPDFVRAGIRHYRIELVDEPATAVAPLLTHYQALLSAVLEAEDHGCGEVPDGRVEGCLKEVWGYVEGLANGHGEAQGVGVGSLEVRQERGWGGMKPTARR